MNNINEDSESSEHQIGDDPQYVDVEIDAEKADEVKEKNGIILAQLEEKIGGRIAEDVKGYSKAIDIFGKQIGKLPETINSLLKKSLLFFRKLLF